VGRRVPSATSSSGDRRRRRKETKEERRKRELKERAKKARDKRRKQAKRRRSSSSASESEDRKRKAKEKAKRKKAEKNRKRPKRREQSSSQSSRQESEKEETAKKEKKIKNNKAKQEKDRKPVQSISDTSEEETEAASPTKQDAVGREAPAALEVEDSERCSGLFLRCGSHGALPMYRRLEAAEEPLFLHFRAPAAWCVARDPRGTGECQELWRTSASSLPLTDRGQRGGHMKARGLAEVQVRAALAALPDGPRSQLRAALRDALGPAAEATAFPNEVALDMSGLRRREEAVIAVEVSGSAGANGSFLLCGSHNGRPMFRRAKDEDRPLFLFFRDGKDAGWFASSTQAVEEEAIERWRTAGTLPALEPGEKGGRMQAQTALDHAMLSTLASMPDGLSRELRAAFSAALSGESGPGPPARPAVEVSAPAAPVPEAGPVAAPEPAVVQAQDERPLLNAEEAPRPVPHEAPRIEERIEDVATSTAVPGEGEAPKAGAGGKVDGEPAGGGRSGSEATLVPPEERQALEELPPEAPPAEARVPGAPEVPPALEAPAPEAPAEAPPSTTGEATPRERHKAEKTKGRRRAKKDRREEPPPPPPPPSGPPPVGAAEGAPPPPPPEAAPGVADAVPPPPPPGNAEDGGESDASARTLIPDNLSEASGD